MKRLRRVFLSLLLILALAVSAFAAVPDNLVTENLNGQQRLVKTYTLPPDAGAKELEEPPFQYDGFFYTWAYTTKEEHPFLKTRAETETVTVETQVKDLSRILDELQPSIPFDDGEYKGELTLDHDSLHTEAKGYATGYNTLTATKTIGPVDRNDMSYVPATTVRNGVTLSLSNVEWQVVGTDLVGDALAPASYQAVATYSGASSYQYATGYVTTATYKGDVTSEGIGSVTYTVVFTGEEIQPAEPEEPAEEPPAEPEPPEPPAETETPDEPSEMERAVKILLLLLLIAALAVALFFVLRAVPRGNVYVYVPTQNTRDYRLIGKREIRKERPVVDLRDMELSRAESLAVEIKRRAAKKLAGMTVSVLYQGGEHTYTVGGGQRDDWHEFDLNGTEEETE